MIFTGNVIEKLHQLETIKKDPERMEYTEHRSPVRNNREKQPRGEAKAE